MGDFGDETAEGRKCARVLVVDGSESPATLGENRESHDGFANFSGTTRS
jgi:hypothetical protein